jgi:hypothetical protein
MAAGRRRGAPIRSAQRRACACCVCAGRQYFEQVKAAEALKDEDFIVDDEGEDFEDMLFARLQTGEFGGSSEEDDDDDFVPVSSG